MTLVMLRVWCRVLNSIFFHEWTELRACDVWCIVTHYLCRYTISGNVWFEICYDILLDRFSSLETSGHFVKYSSSNNKYCLPFSSNTSTLMFHMVYLVNPFWSLVLLDFWLDFLHIFHIYIFCPQLHYSYLAKTCCTSPRFKLSNCQ